MLPPLRYRRKKVTTAMTTMRTTPAASSFRTNWSTGTPRAGGGGGEVGRRRGRRPTRRGLLLGRDVPEVRVGVVTLLRDGGLPVGREDALHPVERDEPGLVDDVLVELLGGSVRVGLRPGLDRLEETVDLRVLHVDRVEGGGVGDGELGHLPRGRVLLELEQRHGVFRREDVRGGVVDRGRHVVDGDAYVAEVLLDQVVARAQE